jgi:hypothetical protein
MSKNYKRSPLKLISGAITALGAYDWGGKRKKEIAESQDEYDSMKRKFMGLDTSNLYGDVSNPYANMENTMEDLTVNQQQAQFESQQGQQQRANIMSQMGGAAGSSGVAGLAQAMANQGQLQTQRSSASIGQQEAANQKAAATQAGALQKMERQGAWKSDMTKRAGAEQSRALEKQKVNTLFTMSANRLGTAKTAHQQAQQQMWEGIGSAVTPMDDVSDERLKENIVKIKYSDSGIPIYQFNYKGDATVWRGTMAQDLIKLGKERAVTKYEDGYYRVNYGLIDVNMEKVNRL